MVASYPLESLKNRSLFLGSQSPRRSQLLTEMGLSFETFTMGDLDESFSEEMDSNDVAAYLSKKKANTLFPHINAKNPILITADTVVVVNNTILGKPKDAYEASEMLSELSGKEHLVITGVTLMSNNKTITFGSTTFVTFKTLSQKEIEHYIKHYIPLDKAGSYGIQEWIGLIGITAINGSYFNVMGLPTERLFSELVNF